MKEVGKTQSGYLVELTEDEIEVIRKVTLDGMITGDIGYVLKTLIYVNNIPSILRGYADDLDEYLGREV